jgi:hypothetical protein
MHVVPKRRATDRDELAEQRDSLLRKELMIDKCNGMIAELQSKLLRLHTESAMLREEISRAEKGPRP